MRLKSVKSIKKIGEDAKVAIRNARRDANEEVKKLDAYFHILKCFSIIDEFKKLINDFIGKIFLL